MPDWIDAVKLTWMAIGMVIGFDIALLAIILVLRARRH